MADIIGSFGRGFSVGDAVASRWTQRKFNRGMAELEEQYASGQLNEEQLDAAMRKLAQSSGAGMRGSADVGGALGQIRESMAGADQRRAAGLIGQSDYDNAYGALGSAAARRGDVSGALAARQGRTAAANYEVGPDGRPLLDRQSAALAREQAMGGDLGSAAQTSGFSEDQRMQTLLAYGGQLSQLAGTLYDQTGVINPSVAEQMDAIATTAAQRAGLPIERVQYDDENQAFFVYDTGGKAVAQIGKDDIDDFFTQFAESPEAVLPGIIGARRQQAADINAANADTAKAKRDALLDVFKNLFGDAKAATVTADAFAGAAKAGLKVHPDTVDERGNLLVELNGQVLKLIPGGTEGDSGIGGTTFTLLDEAGNAVSSKDMPAKQRLAAQQLALAVAQANTTLDLESRVTAFQTAQQLLFGGEAPAGGGAGQGGAQTALPGRRPGGPNAGSAAALGARINMSPESTAEAVEQAVPFILGLETSAGQPDGVKNSLSSATGRGQFLNDTWLDMVKRNRPDLLPPNYSDSNPEQRRRVLALRADPELSREMTAQYAAENARSLERAGLPVNVETLYLAHHFGAKGARNLLSVPEQTPIEDVLTEREIKANPTYAGKTVGEVRDSFMARMEEKSGQRFALGGGGPASRGGARRPDSALPVSAPATPATALDVGRRVGGTFAAAGPAVVRGTQRLPAELEQAWDSYVDQITAPVQLGYDFGTGVKQGWRGE